MRASYRQIDAHFTNNNKWQCSCATMVFAGCVVLTVLLWTLMWTFSGAPNLTDFQQFIILGKNKNDLLTSRQCSDNAELMTYTVAVQSHENRTANFISGQQFNDSFALMLQRYRLADVYRIQKAIPVQRPGQPGFVFVVAASTFFFPFLRTVLYHIKTKFGCAQRIIGYDLGGISENIDMMKELNAVCALEWRRFDWSEMPENVHHPQIFAWKIHIFAQILHEFDTFIYCDTAIQIDDPNSFESTFQAIQREEIAGIVVPRDNYHGMRFATNPRMYTFLPFMADWTRMPDEWVNDQYEASFVIVHRNEYTRQLLKWALLCAMTRECIEPVGSILDCDMSRKNEEGVCNRQDQSVLNLLRANAEWQRMPIDQKFLPHFDKNHPRRSIKFTVKKRTKLEGNVDFVKAVQCCQSTN